MLFNFKTLAVTLFASIALAKAFVEHDPNYERDLVDGGEFDLTAREYEDVEARSHLDAALASLSTRALVSELNDRLERRGKGSAAERAREDAIKRCREILASAAGKTIHRKALMPLEDCLKKLSQLEGRMPVVNWKVAA